MDQEEEYKSYIVNIGPNQQVAYDPTTILGQGSFGRVYQGIINNGKKRVAVKILYRNALILKRRNIDYQKEVNLLEKLDNPYILKFQLFYIDKKSNVYIVTELCQRSSLHTEIQRARFSFSRVFKYSYQIIYAMKYMHAMKCMHRDLKPENIFLTLEDNTKIGDLGIAKQILDEDIEKLITNTIIGTPIYSSPQIILERKYNFKCDVWSVGCIIYEMLTRERLFLSKNGESVKTTHKKFEQNKNEYLKSIQDPFWRKILNKMLAYQEKDRINFQQLFMIFSQENNKKYHLRITQQEKNEKQPFLKKQIINSFEEAMQIEQQQKIDDRVYKFLDFKHQKIEQIQQYIQYFDQIKMFYPANPCSYYILAFLLCYWNKMEICGFEKEIRSQQIKFQGKIFKLKRTQVNQQFLSKINYQGKLDIILEFYQRCILQTHSDTFYSLRNVQSLTDLLFNYKQKAIPASDVMKMFRSFLEKFGIQKKLISKKSPSEKLQIYRVIVGMFQLCQIESKFTDNSQDRKNEIKQHFQKIRKTKSLQELQEKIQPLIKQREEMDQQVELPMKQEQQEAIMSLLQVEDALPLLKFREHKVNLTYQYLSRFQEAYYFPIPLCYKCIFGFLLMLLNRMQKNRLYSIYKNELFDEKKSSIKEAEIYKQFQKKRYQVLQGIQTKINKLNGHLRQNADYILGPNRRIELLQVLDRIPDLKYILEKYNELETQQQQVTNLLKIFLRQFASPFQKIEFQLAQEKQLEVFRLIAAFYLLFDKEDRFPNKSPYDLQSMKFLFESIDTMNQSQLKNMLK